MSRAPRPLRHSDCADGPRPCPYISCRHHLAIDLTGSGQLDSHLMDGALRPRASAEQVEAWTSEVAEKVAEMGDTCSLDVAARGPMTLSEVGQVYGMTREAIRLIEVRALVRKMRLPMERGGWDKHEPADPAGPAELMIRARGGVEDDGEE
jgi:hypothetical protein